MIGHPKLAEIIPFEGPRSALEVGSPSDVETKSGELATEDHLLSSPRWTGDRNYEAVARDPDKNQIVSCPPGQDTKINGPNRPVMALE
jgi:hypothetical protein